MRYNHDTLGLEVVLAVRIALATMAESTIVVERDLILYHIA